MDPPWKGLVGLSIVAWSSLDRSVYSCGPSFGRFTHAIPSSAMGPGTLYPDAHAIVVAVLSAFAAAGMAW